jgi:hypothetical protein
VPPGVLAKDDKECKHKAGYPFLRQKDNNIVTLSKYCLQAYMLAEIFAYKGKFSLHSSGIKIPNLSMILGIIIIIIIIPFHPIVIYFTKNMIEVWY